MRVAITGGKTGGHLYPGIALAESLTEKGHSVHFLSGHFPLEKNILQASSWPYHPIISHSPSYGLIKFALRTGQGFVQAWGVLKKIKPDVVVGLGGFPSVPAIVAARVRGIPVVILEQNSVPGEANIFLAQMARNICISFPHTEWLWDQSCSSSRLKRWVLRWSKSVPAKCVVTGNPIRAQFGQMKARDRAQLRAELGLAADKPVLLVMGGSQGSQRINGMIADLIPLYPDVQWVHVAGEADYDKVVELYAQHPHIVSKVWRFLGDMPRWMAAADVVVGRAGATTLAELDFLQKTALVIPIKHSFGNHQYLNAQAYASKGRIHVVQETERLCEDVESFLSKWLDGRLASAHHDVIEATHEALPQDQIAAVLTTILL